MQLSSHRRVATVGIVIGGSLAPGIALADDVADTGLDQLVVTGVRSLTTDKLPDGVKNVGQTIDVVSHETLEAQAVSRLAQALQNVPGITLNAGEGAARGDTVNLRGFPAYNDFFLDGIRDAAVYTRDSFDLEDIEVLKGPSAVLFGRGSTGGAINQVSKAPTLAPIWSGAVVGGTNSEIRGTADVDAPIGPSAAIRLNAMGERSGVADRDGVVNRRWGLAPSVEFGIGQPDTVTASFLHQSEADTPDEGLPFVIGAPAPVNRANDYGLDSDRMTADVNVGTLRYRHAFSSAVDIASTLRFGDYSDLDQFDAPNFSYYNSPGAPAATTPLGQVLVGRDSPSSSGRRTDLIDQTDLTARFATGPVSHTLVAGIELGRERDNTVRFANPLGSTAETPATPLLDPNPNAIAPTQPGKTRAITTAFSEAAYAIDTLHLGDKVDLTGGLRFDRFSAHYRPHALIPGVSASSLTPLDHVDDVVSPRASLVFKPKDSQRFYISYGTSFDPSAEALSLSTKTANLGPVEAKSYEAGFKLDWFDGRLSGTGAAFHTEVDNAQTTDPENTAAVILAGDQRVEGFELGLNGRITDKWEIVAGYTFLNAKTIASTTTSAVGKWMPNVAQNAVNLWTEYEFTERWELGAGLNYLGRRWADTAQTASLPAYTIFNAMAAYTVNKHISLQVNANNVFNALAWQSVYYTSPAENHVIPAPGRTVLFTVAFKN